MRGKVLWHDKVKVVLNYILYLLPLGVGTHTNKEISARGLAVVPKNERLWQNSLWPYPHIYGAQ